MYCLVLAGLLGGLTVSRPAQAAACAAPATNYGSATLTISVPSTATYRIWSRISTPDTTNTTYMMEVDSANCYTVGGNGINPLTWTWVDYQSSGSGNKVQLALTQGSHTFRLIGNAPNVKVDRILAVSDLSCTPTDFGDNCNTPADTAAPAVALTTPTEGRTVSGATTLSATATDNTGVTKVEFYDNSSLITSVSTSPYTASWDTTKVASGTHTLTAKAYDAAGNIGSDSNQVTVQNGDNQAPTVPTGLAASAPAYNKVVLSWKASTDTVGVTGYTIIRDGVPLADVGNSTSYTDTQGILPSTTYQYQVLAFDAANNKSGTSSKVSVTTPGTTDTQAPTAPTNLNVDAASPTQTVLTWTASTDTIGVARYDIYRHGSSGYYDLIGSSQTTSYGDTNLTPGTNYSYYVVARDAAGNSSQPSKKDDVTLPKATPSSSALNITGTITDKTSGNPIKHALVVIRIGGSRHYYRANSHGHYAVRRLKTGRYDLTYSASGYKAFATSIKLGSSSIVNNVALTKK